MPRPRRIWSKDHYHHVTSRGNWRGDLFRKKGDFIYFFHLVEQMCAKFGSEIASYCAMTNHYHLLVRSEKVHLSNVIGWLNQKYAIYYNKRYNVSGHLFEKRFFSKPIFDPLGVAEVSCYIHLNPIKARIVDHPEQYDWSSFRYFRKPHSTHPSYLNIHPVLNLFPGKTTEQRINQYCSWISLKTEEEIS